MAVKQVQVDGIGPVSMYKRRGARSVRISITHQGIVRVSLPSWAPYSTGIDFVQSRKDWILSELPKTTMLHQGYRVGKAHHISFSAGSGKSVSTRISGNEARILLPIGIRWDSPEAQEAAKSCAIRVLKKEAKMLLPARVDTLAKQFDFTYNSVAIKQLSGRWGSCNEKRDIILNCFLMQLPWELIDYVILHELTHTKIMAHGPIFWKEMERVAPNIKSLRSRMKSHKPVL